jgi:hypothetical protein
MRYGGLRDAHAHRTHDIDISQRGGGDVDGSSSPPSPLPLLLPYRLLLLFSVADVCLFPATQHRRATDNPDKTPLGPLLLRCLALYAAALSAAVAHYALSLPERGVSGRG